MVSGIYHFNLGLFQVAKQPIGLLLRHQPFKEKLFITNKFVVKILKSQSIYTCEILLIRKQVSYFFIGYL